MGRFLNITFISIALRHVTIIICVDYTPLVISAIFDVKRLSRRLMQFDTVSDELRHIQLPNYMRPRHAVESPTGTFIVSHCAYQLRQYQVSEVDTDGEVLRQFSRSHLPPYHGISASYIAVDSHGNIMIQDEHCRILLLDDHLTLRRVIVDVDLNDLDTYKDIKRVCYTEQSGQLVVGYIFYVAVFDVLSH